MKRNDFLIKVGEGGGRKNNLMKKENLVKKFCQQNFVEKNFVKKTWLKNCWYNKSFGLKKLSVQTNFWPKTNLVKKKGEKLSKNI